MVLRLILVGLVAGLGLSMPTRRDLDTMTRSAHHWVDDRLAEWGNPRFAESDPEPYVFVVDPAANVVPLAIPALGVARAPATASALVSDEVFAGILQDSVAGFAQDSLANATREQDQFVKSRPQLAALEPSQSFAIELPTEPAKVITEDWISTDLTEIAFEGWADEMPLSKPVELAAAKPPNPLDLAFAGVLEEIVVRFDQDASALAATPRSPSDELLEINEVLYAGEAYALNRISDATATTTEADQRGSRLTKAVRLTSQAVVAWASLIQGPAVVTLAR